jgi:hypothetical protein
LGRNFEFDVSSIVPEDRDGGIFYRTDYLRRVMPGPGDYPVLLHGGKGTGAAKTGAVVLKDGIFVPHPGDGEAPCRIEFFEGSVDLPPRDGALSGFPRVPQGV